MHELMLRFDVYGRRLGVRRANGMWDAVWLGSDGSHRPAPGVAIPPDVEESKLVQFLSDLFHESSTPERPDVALLND